MFVRPAERRAWRASLFAVLLFVPHAALAQPRPWQPTPQFELRASDAALTAEIDQATAWCEARGPGMALALIRNGQPIVTRYAGVEDVARGTPIGPESRFYIASLAKTMTATAVLMLRERGALRLEDSLSRWIPGMPACAGGVRLIHLLQHTSGLPDYLDVAGDSARIHDNAGVLAFVRDLDSLAFAPGERYAYSNTGYVLLAEVVGLASRRDYASFVEDSILRPLGMNGTRLVRRGMVPIEHRATGYRRDGARFVIDDVRDRWTLGSGGVYSTLPDIVLWYRAVMESRLLKPSSTALLFDTPVTLSGRRSYLGMGWSDESPGPRTPEVAGLRAYGSFGILAGFQSSILFYPDHGLAWIALSNAAEGALPPQGMVGRLFHRVPQGNP